MKVLVSGSRYFCDRALLCAELDKLCPTHIIEGGQTGADTMARRYGRTRGLLVTTVHAEWVRYGAAAGPMRNREMLHLWRPDYVLAFPLKGSKGTLDMIREARRQLFSVVVIGDDPT